jgi:hypothetical protein
MREAVEKLLPFTERGDDLFLDAEMQFAFEAKARFAPHRGRIELHVRFPSPAIPEFKNPRGQTVGKPSFGGQT